MGDPAENKSHTCPNPLCGKSFTSPIKVENVGNGIVYEACPYCLAEIIVERPVFASGTEQKIPEEGKAEEKPSAKKKLEIQTVQEKTECKHYFGYLSKRPSKESLPEECIVCEKIVQCMLKTITE